MNVIYKIPITIREVESEEFPSITVRSDSNISVQTTNEYINISGEYYVKDKISPVCNYLAQGSTLYPKYSGADIQLSSTLEDPSIIQAYKALALIGQATTTDAFKALVPYIKKATKVASQTYQIESILAYNSEAMFFNIDSGNVALVQTNAFINSNRISTTSYDGTLFYFLFNNSFKVDPKDTYCISKQNISQLPFGFCNFAYKKPLVTSLQLLPDMILLNTGVAAEIKATALVSFDGIISNTYYSQNKESIIIKTTLENISATALDASTTTNTLTLISHIEPNGDLVPYLLLAGSAYSGVFTDTSPITLTQFLLFDEEFKKEYVYNTYEVSFLEGATYIGSINNQDFYNNILQNVSIYQNIVNMV